MARLEVETFLYEEAALLDEWRLEEWLGLLTVDARYEVPSADALDGGPDDSLMLVSDSRATLEARVRRLLSGRAYREVPRSRTRRVIGNVRLLGVNGDELIVTANFTVYRFRRDVTAFMGRYIHHLVRTDDGFRIRFRRTELDLENFHENGTLSIII
jgi:p-cumate 2,3-dioxygenase beta subunit